jgi:hypothetical protein
MRKTLIIFAILGLMLGFAACQENTAPDVNDASATATAQEMYNRVPADVPVMDGAYELRVSSTGNSISYRVQAVFEDVIKYYQEQTPAMGWEQLGGEQIMSDSITMQRMKPDKNMSILISAIEGGNEVMVRVMIASR